MTNTGTKKYTKRTKIYSLKSGRKKVIFKVITIISILNVGRDFRLRIGRAEAISDLSRVSYRFKVHNLTHLQSTKTNAP